jgi:uncharacterized protein YcaQ
LTTALSAGEARRLALRAQGMLGAPPRRSGPGAVAAMLRRLGAVQLDTISVLARSHELVPYARLGPVGRAAVEEAYWGPGPGAIEYWSHAACLLPVENWPLYAFRRREFAAKGKRWHDVPAGLTDQVLGRLAAEGPLTSTELGGARKGGPWWDWSGVKIAVEWLLDLGEVVCVRRTGWRRVYDLPGRALPADVVAADVLDDDECVLRLVALAGASLGVATLADLADYHRLSRAQVAAALSDSGLQPVTVEGWAAPAWADAEALEGLGLRGRHRTTLLSPFDSLVWDRARTRRVFGFTHALEAYKPAARREHGYFAMPLLAGGRLLGRVDPKRVDGVLVGQTVSLDSPAAVEPMAAALHEAASWVGASDVRVERVRPPELAAALGAAIARA